MKFEKLINVIKRKEIGYYISLKWNDFSKRKKRDLLPFAEKYVFDNRSHDAENLIMVLMGFQPYYWDGVIERVKRNVEQFDETIDVCLCVPCGASENVPQIVRDLARVNNFSYLYIEDDLLAQVQNTAIKLHPNAKWIFKIDEDIIISDNYFNKMKKTWSRATHESYYPIGFVSPLINLNAGGFRIFLESIDQWNDFSARFPSQHYWSGDMLGDYVHKNTSVAMYIWEKSVPFDDVAKSIDETNRGEYSICPIRMSIGAIMFTRDKWEEWKYFEVAGIGAMGREEEQICAHTINNMQVIIIAEDVFAGHLGFYWQKEKCLKFYTEHINDIKHK